MRLSVASFALGNLFCSQYMTESYQTPKSDVYDYVNFAIGLILYFIPLTLILQYFHQLPEHIGMLYENEWIFLASEYDRINPLTIDEGMERYAKSLILIK